MTRELAAAGATIVSGLARGIDSAAHRGALESGGRTLAVLGSALDCLYPRENADLAAAISERGAVVSELAFGTEARPGTFPRRNRILAGWGLGVVVIEAAQKSGALITARCALDEGREVLAVPGHPGHAGSSGTNQLIRDGAALVRDAADVAAELGLALPVARVAAATSDEVLGALRPDVPASLDEIQERSGRPVTELLARLSELELGRQVRRLPGALYVRQ
jgi:DNA processing protein